MWWVLVHLLGNSLQDRRVSFSGVHSHFAIEILVLFNYFVNSSSRVTAFDDRQIQFDLLLKLPSDFYSRAGQLLFLFDPSKNRSFIKANKKI